MQQIRNIKEMPNKYDPSRKHVIIRDKASSIKPKKFYFNTHVLTTFSPLYPWMTSNR